MESDPIRELLRLRRAQLGIAIFALCILNMVAFSIHSERLGGRALTGKIEGGRYYVGDHGHYTEVTGASYRNNRAHELACIASLPFGLVTFILLWSAARKPERRRSAVAVR
jgi:hypothetical protein